MQTVEIRTPIDQLIKCNGYPMNRRQLLLATASSAIVTTKTTAAASVAAPNIEKFAHQPIVGWQIELSSDTREVDSHTALFVLGKCECAVPEIAKLNLPISTIGYLDGSVHWPSSGDFFAEGWNIGRKRISKIDDAMEFAKRTIEANNRVILLGNFSAPFASEMLATLAKMARHTNRPVVAIGGTPAPGAHGEIRTQRGWTCIEELRRIGCCVTTVPEVDFYSDQFEQVDSVAASTLRGVDEGHLIAAHLSLHSIKLNSQSRQSVKMYSRTNSARETLCH